MRGKEGWNMCGCCGPISPKDKEAEEAKVEKKTKEVGSKEQEAKRERK